MMGTMKVGTCTGVLALTAALLLPPGDEAQARDECGALDSSGAATCSDQAYA